METETNQTPRSTYGAAAVCVAWSLLLMVGCARGAGQSAAATGCGASSADAAPSAPLDAGWSMPDAARVDAGRVSDAGSPDDAAMPGDVDAALASDAGPVSPDGGPSHDAAIAMDAGTPRDAAAIPGADAGCEHFTATNSAHVLAGRALFCPVLHACALGSGDDLGDYYATEPTTVHRTGPYRFELGPCR